MPLDTCLSRHLHEAKAELTKAQELNAQHSALHLIRSQILLLEGHPQEAVTEIEQETIDWQKLSGQALAYFGAGRRQDADNALQKLIATHHNNCAYQIAQVYAYRGETDKAFEWLDRAYKQRDPGIREVTNDPVVQECGARSALCQLIK